MAYIPGRKERKKKTRGEGRDASPEELREEDPRSSDHDLIKLQKAYQELEYSHHQVRESYVEMILKMAIAAEYRDPDTGSHILRISDYATEVGKAIGLELEQMEVLRYASPMHDVGKIAIPDHILQKPGKLTPEEWEVMKTHTLIGARIFGNTNSPVLQAAAQIALTHHEKFDGSGYPQGLKGQNIPIFGRIVAMVDVFDAVVSKRCYKEKWSLEEGLDHIKTLSGNHLDPKLVDAFTKIQKNIRHIYAANTTIQDFLREAREEGKLKI